MQIEKAEDALGELLRCSADKYEVIERLENALREYGVRVLGVVFDTTRCLCAVVITIEHPEEGSVILRGSYADDDVPQTWFEQETAQA